MTIPRKSSAAAIVKALDAKRGNLTDAQWATLAQMHRQTLWKVLNGHYTPSIEVLEKMARALGYELKVDMKLVKRRKA